MKQVIGAQLVLIYNEVLPIKGICESNEKDGSQNHTVGILDCVVIWSSPDVLGKCFEMATRN